MGFKSTLRRVDERASLRTKILLLLISLCLAALALNIFWSSNSQQAQAERELLEKARILTIQTSAVWEFMDINQDRIDTDSDGSYNFKGVYCAIAGKSIAVFFSRDSDYLIRYVSEQPRKRSALPDAFEAKAFEQFSSGSDEYWGLADYNGMEAFRYITPIHMKESCLDCHGSPKGELDVTGYAKEGLGNGDLGGAVSIVMPIDLYMESSHDNITQQIVYFSALVILLVLVTFLAITHLFTRPLSRMKAMTAKVGGGDLGVSADDIKASGEIRELADCLASMAGQLKVMYADLEGKVKLRTSQLEDANILLEQQRNQLAVFNAQLQEENRFRSDFFAIMSHELKTPLTAIIAFTEVWERSSAGKSDKDAAAIKEIRLNGYLLLQMINNILEMARAEAGRTELSLEAFDIMDLIGVIEANTKYQAEQKSIGFTTKVHARVPIIKADYEKIRRIVDNLVSNAIKFTRKGGRVHVEVDFDMCAKEVVIAVSDTGIGITEDNLEAIFKRFSQVDKSAFRRYSGSGLGLAVVKEFVELHNGRIEVESRYKEGSTFTVHIPVDDGWIDCA